MEGEEESGKEDKQSEGTSFTRRLRDKTTELMLVEELDHETSRMTERLVVLRIATKHNNLWTRQLEMKRKEMSELAGLMKLDVVKKEIANEMSIERWARRCTHYFTKKAKRMLFEEIDNMVWSGIHQDITRWCKEQKKEKESTNKLKGVLLKKAFEKMKRMTIIEELDGETTRVTERGGSENRNEAHQHLDPPARDEKKGNERAGGVDEAWRNQEGDYEGEVPREMGKKMHPLLYQEGEESVVRGNRQHGVEW